MESRATRQFTKGQTILLEGTPGDSTFRILIGEVIVCKKSSTGEQVPIAKLSEGEVFGEMYLFNTNLNRTASVIALSSDVRLEVMPQDEVRAMMTGLHPAINRIFEGLCMRLQKVSTKYVQTVAAQKAHARTADGTATTDSNTYIHRPPVE